LNNFTVVVRIRVIVNAKPGYDLHIYDDVLDGLITLTWEPHEKFILPLLT